MNNETDDKMVTEELVVKGIGKITTIVEKGEYIVYVSSFLETEKGDKVVLINRTVVEYHYGRDEYLFEIMDSDAAEYGELAYQLTGEAPYSKNVDIRIWAHAPNTTCFLLFGEDTLAELANIKEVKAVPRIVEHMLHTIFEAFRKRFYKPHAIPNLCFAYLACPEESKADKKIVEMLRKAHCGVFNCAAAICCSEDCYTTFYLSAAYESKRVKKWQTTLPEYPEIVEEDEDEDDYGDISWR